MIQARFATLAALAWLAAGCGGGATQGATRPEPARRDASVLLQDEIDKVSAQTLYDVIRALRPAWLVERAPSTLADRRPETPTVYVDGMRLGGVQTLQQLVPSTVATVRYYSAIDAQTRFGPGQVAGVIEVTSRP
jgi:hypothetical protein